jgi:modification methylase
MFSFVGDTVLDPFLGSGATMLAAMRNGRNSIGCEIDPTYLFHARRRIPYSSDRITYYQVSFREEE